MRARVLVLATILSGYLLVLVDVSIVMVALPHVRDDLGFSATALSWVQNAYTLAFGGLLLLGARAGDLLGRRRAFIAGIGLFTVASLAVGLAQSPAWLIAARAVQGIGAATLAPSTLALLSTSFPEGPRRNRAMAAYGALAGIGVTAGLLLGGVLTDWLSWRVGFFINVPVGIAAMLAAPRLLEETARHEGRLEPAGALSSTLGIGLVVYGIVRSADAGWGDAVTLAAVGAGVALIGLFAAGQVRSDQPLVPLRLFADRERAGAYAARFLFNGTLLSSFFFLTLYLQGVSGYSPLQAGVAFLPQTVVAFLVAAAVVPPLTRRLGTARVAVAGVAAMVVTTAWLSRLTAGTDYLTGVALPMVVYGIAQGLALTSLTTAGMAGVGPRDAGAAGGVVNVAHHLGGALGLGILTAVFASAGAPGEDARELLAHRVGAAFTGGTILAVAALAVTLIATRSRPTTDQGDSTCRSPAAPSRPRPGRATGSPARSTSTRSPRRRRPRARRRRSSTSPPAPVPRGTRTRWARRSS